MPEDDNIRVCSILESIAEQYAPDSPEYEALRDAAVAYKTVQHNRILKDAFEKLRAALDAPLTEEMKDDLRRHGIDPDSFEDD